MRKIYSTFLSLLMMLVFHSVLSGQADSPAREISLEELSARYDVDNWPGKYGSVVPGIRPEAMFTNDSSLLLDHIEWLDVNGEQVVLRQFTTGNKKLTVGVSVARTCRTAHRILFNHLSRLKSIGSFDPPALPYGETRLTDIGDVCFALPQHGGETFRSIEFIRNNIVILLTAKSGLSTDIITVATAIDKVIMSQPVYPDWRSSKRWISIDRFELSDTLIKPGSMNPVLISITDPMDESFITGWRISAGGIVDKNGVALYYCEGEGEQTITLLTANDSGLAASAQFDFEVRK